MTKAERAGIENGIWLCSNCATTIDRDTNKYTIPLLNRWKDQAEKKAMEELGREPLSRGDYDAMHSLVFGKLKRTPLTDSVEAICRLSSEALESRDPRFKVTVERSNGRTNYTLCAQEPVQLSVKACSGFEQEFKEKFIDLTKHGHEIEVSSDAIAIEGSPLFNDLDLREGRFFIGPSVTHKASAVLELTDHEEATSKFLCEFDGILTSGTETAHFKGKAWGGLIDLSIQFPLNEHKAIASISLDLEAWHGSKVTALPYFDRVMMYCDGILKDKSLNLAFEINGRTILASRVQPQETNNKQNLALLLYIRNARKICESIGRTVTFDPNFQITWEEFNSIDELRARLEITDISELNSNLQFTLTPPQGKDVTHVDEFISASVSGTVLRVDQTLEVELFGQPLPACKMITSLSKAQMRKVQELPGNAIRVEAIPLDGCEFRTSLEL